MPTIHISHISSGVTETGGYRQEQCLLKALAEYYTLNGWSVTSLTLREHRFYKGIAQFQLLRYGFIRSKYTINIVVWRMALAAILRNLLAPNRKILIPIHHYDEREITSTMGRFYFKTLMWLLCHINFANVAVVSLSPSWHRHLNTLFKGKNAVFLFPTLFPFQNYERFKTSKKINRIYLGQFSSKNHPSIFTVAKKLASSGFQCYFSTLDKKQAGIFDTYEVRFMSHTEYLEWMAQSKYTICFSGINEGWNRVAHESILVGTYVIANNSGGLGDLVRESGSLMANSDDEILRFVLANEVPKLDHNFSQRYDEKNTFVWLKPITDFLLHGTKLNR
jgi:glycosyltransferase involved in cell wall biosynthesis